MIPTLSSSSINSPVLPAPIVNPLSPSAAASPAEVPEHHDVYVTAPIMVPAPVVYTPPTAVTYMPASAASYVPPRPQPVVATHIPPHRRRADPVVPGAVTGVAAGVTTVAVVDCCCGW